MSTDELADRLKKLADKATQLTQHTDEAYKLLRNVDQLENDAQRLAQGKKTGDPTQAFAFPLVPLPSLSSSSI